MFIFRAPSSSRDNFHTQPIKHIFNGLIVDLSYSPITTVSLFFIATSSPYRYVRSLLSSCSLLCSTLSYVVFHARAFNLASLKIASHRPSRFRLFLLVHLLAGEQTEHQSRLRSSAFLGVDFTTHTASFVSVYVPHLDFSLLTSGTHPPPSAAVSYSTYATQFCSCQKL